jgi:aarF domain-containing kinase
MLSSMTGISPGVIVVLVTLAVVLLVCIASRTAQRMLKTGWVATRALGAGLVARATGHRDRAPAILRKSFEDLGPTYIKLGQLIASSQGLFPERYCIEFRKCLDRVRPFEYVEVQRILRAELGRDPKEVFASIDEAPLASASIAQVHSARLLDGKDVVIKVQRPLIDQLVEADLRVLHFMARLMLFLPLGELANPRGVVEDFESNIREELDFRREAENMSEFNRIMREHGQSLVAAPEAVVALTTPRVLVMERFFGFRVDDVAKLREANFDGEEKLLVGMRAWFQCMILHGFFHGDVHAGNLMALSDGRIGFLDFGIVGRFARERREQITDYLMAFAAGDFRKLADVMVAMGSAGEKVDLDALARDLGAAYKPMLENDASAVKYADIIPSTMRAAVRHGLRLPRDFVLVVKQMLYFDRYAKILAPSLNVFRDPRLMAALTMDMMQAKMQAAQPGTPAAAS